jgi:hypothetical protein
MTTMDILICPLGGEGGDKRGGIKSRNYAFNFDCLINVTWMPHLETWKPSRLRLLHTGKRETGGGK